MARKQMTLVLLITVLQWRSRHYRVHQSLDNDVSLCMWLADVCVCVLCFRGMAQSRHAKGECERTLYHMENRRKPVQSATRVSQTVSYAANQLHWVWPLPPTAQVRVTWPACVCVFQAEPEYMSLRSLRRTQRKKKQEQRHSYQTRSARERRALRRSSVLGSPHGSDSDSEAEVKQQKF